MSDEDRQRNRREQQQLVWITGCMVGAAIPPCAAQDDARAWRRIEREGLPSPVATPAESSRDR